MSWSLIIRALLCSFILVTCRCAYADTVTYDFNGGTLGDLIPSVNTVGYAYNVSGGVLNVSAAAGTGNGSVWFTTPFSVSGDFVATIDATRSDLRSNGDMAIEMAPVGGVMDIYEFGPSSIFSNSDPAHGLFAASGDSNITVNLKIARVGNTVTTSFSDNGGVTYSTLLTANDAGFAGSTPIYFLFDQEQGNTAAQTGYFDNLTITSDSISTPLPGSALGGTVLLGTLALGMVLRARKLDYPRV